MVFLLKKDFKVFVYNGGYDKNIKKLEEDMGFDLQDLPPELLYGENENDTKKENKNYLTSQLKNSMMKK